MHIIEDILPEGISSAHVVTDFWRGKSELERLGYHIPSFEEVANLRMQMAMDDVCMEENLVGEGIIYTNEGNFLVRDSPTTSYPDKVRMALRESNKFYLTDRQFEIFSKNSVKLPKGYSSIPTNRFGEEEVTVYAFGDSAGDYGKFLEQRRIGKMPIGISTYKDVKEPFARQALLMGLHGGSAIGSNNSINPEMLLIRGVKGYASRKEEKYTLLQIGEALDEIGYTQISKGLIEKLRNP